MDVLRKTSQPGVYLFWCPGCEEHHAVWTKEANELTGAKWDWNGLLSSPTFNPSLFVNKGQACPGQPACHFFVRDGRMQFLSDCTHSLAGHTVAMQPID